MQYYWQFKNSEKFEYDSSVLDEVTDRNYY